MPYVLVQNYEGLWTCNSQADCSSKAGIRQCREVRDDVLNNIVDENMLS